MNQQSNLKIKNIIFPGRWKESENMEQTHR